MFVEPLHEPTLRRVTDERPQPLATFLALGVLDSYHVSERHRDDISRSRAIAALDFIQKLNPRDAESYHAEHVIRAFLHALTSGASMRAVLAPIRALVEALEGEMCYEAAIDVLETPIRVFGPADPQLEMECQIKLAGVLRQLCRHSGASAAYQRVIKLGHELDNQHYVFLGRIGLGNLARYAGNIPESIRLLEGVVRDATNTDDRDAAARANHDLGMSLWRFDADRALVAIHSAFMLYCEPYARLRALADIGVTLGRLGHYKTADRVFEVCAQSDPPMDYLARLNGERLKVSALLGNRFAFERYRRFGEDIFESMPPNTQIDHLLKVGEGYLVFGESSGCVPYIQKAKKLAEQHALREFFFVAENLLNGICAPKREAAQLTEESERVVSALDRLHAEEYICV